MSVYWDLYKEEVDFSQLAKQDADFAKVLETNGQLDFSKPVPLLQLTKSLLKRDFGLRLELPQDRLCPPVPNRLNYILWIQSLLDTSSPDLQNNYDPSREVTGLDVGTGASCIYPLLGCAMRPKWKFIGTDIDDKSFSYAEKNIALNNLQHRIRLHKSRPEGSLVPLEELGLDRIDFTMTNPPFYTSEEALLESAKHKSLPPSSVCTGSVNEMIHPGGETHFATLLLQSSLHLGARVQWYTTLLGHHSSITPIIALLKSHGITNYAITEFTHSKSKGTRRWAVGWSVCPWRPSVEVSRRLSSIEKGVLPFPTEQVIEVSSPLVSPITLSEKIHQALQSLPVHWQYDAASKTGIVFCEKAVWSRSERRKYLQAQKKRSLETGVSMEVDSKGSADEENDWREMSFGARITILAAGDGHVRAAAEKVLIRWLKGDDSVLFESFCGMVRRVITS